MSTRPLSRPGSFLSGLAGGQAGVLLGALLATLLGACADGRGSGQCTTASCAEACRNAGLSGGTCLGSLCRCDRPDATAMDGAPTDVLARPDGGGQTDGTGTGDVFVKPDSPIAADTPAGPDTPVVYDIPGGPDIPSTPDVTPVEDTPSGPDTPAAEVSADLTPLCNSGDFNFFVISLEAIQLAGGAEGLGGNLGGLAGADELCQRAANAVGACDKRWVAFLCATNDGNGNPVHAIERIGTGPWYDVNGLLLAYDIAGLLHDRPDGDDTTVVWHQGFRDWVFTDCLTTELGNCNHTYGDSHDTLTGCNTQGRLYSSDRTYTCNDWTSTTNNRQCDGTHSTCWPAIGHSWPAMSGQNWIYSHLAGGCQANINLGDSFQNGVGGHGGYGGFYCFGL